jgi:tyrosinase
MPKQGLSSNLICGKISFPDLFSRHQHLLNDYLVRYRTDTYFGGNGSSIDNCVTSGPFANRTQHVGPLEQTTDYCFSRKFNETKGLEWGLRAKVDECYQFGGKEFDSFYNCMALYPHIAGHQAVGGVMTDVDSSPGDPVFYLHHNYLDRLYWQWQQINATERLYLIAGNTTVTKPATGWALLDLKYEMDMFGVVENIRLGDVMNIQGGYLCYAFEY